MLVDLHCDTISKLRDCRLHREFVGKERLNGTEQTLWENDFQLDLKRMKQAGYCLQNFALYIDSEVDSDVFCAYEQMLTIFKEELQENAQSIRQVFGFSDIMKNQEDGVMSALLTVEEGQVASTFERLSQLYRDGVRLITLTWNHPNAIGWPNCVGADGSIQLTKPNTENGLTAYGFELISKMEALHIMIDVSHLSDRGFWDVYENTKRPFLASHSNARAVTEHVRNLSDEMLRRLSERGGIIGVNFETTFLKSVGDCGISAVLRHAEHIRRVGGEDLLALGSDFDGIKGNKELRGVQDMEHLVRALEKAGWKPALIEKFLWKNALRFYRDVLE